MGALTIAQSTDGMCWPLCPKMQFSMSDDFQTSQFAQFAQEMLDDAKNADPIYQPGPYWMGHVKAVLEAVDRCGLENFRSSPEKAITAFSGGQFQPNTALRPRLWRLHDTLKTLPVLKKVAEAYQAEIDGAYARLKSARDRELQLACWLLDDWDAFSELEDLGVGSPPMFEIRGRKYSEKFVDKSLDLLHFKQNWPIEPTSVLEIGAGFGQLAELTAKIYPIDKYVILDLPPNSLFSEYYLSKVFPGEVAGWRHLRKSERVDIEKVDARFIVLPVHMFDRLEGYFDLFVNQGSFQEMTMEIVMHYAARIKRLCRTVHSCNRRTAMLKTSPGLHTEFYQQVFAPLTCKKRWPHPLRYGYDNLIFE